MQHTFLFTFFSLPLIFTLVAASISHFIAVVFVHVIDPSNVFGLLCFLSLALAHSVLSTSMQKERLGFVVVDYL